MKTEIHVARINIKSLAAEAAIIRQEMAKTKDPLVKSRLWNHKTLIVKPEARLAHLALGFLKGMPRSRVETSKKPIDIKKLCGKLCKFCGWSRSITQQEVLDWLQT